MIILRVESCTWNSTCMHLIFDRKIETRDIHLVHVCFICVNYHWNCLFSFSKFISQIYDWIHSARERLSVWKSYYQKEVRIETGTSKGKRKKKFQMMNKTSLFFTKIITNMDIHGFILFISNTCQLIYQIRVMHLATFI